MGRDKLDELADAYDAIVIGSGLGGLTAANQLAKSGHKVLLLEQHYQLGGLATWFRRKGGHIFDISLHGFPFGMVKSCRKYWTKEIADSIVQVKDIRFRNPQFNLSTTYDREDFAENLVRLFGVGRNAVERFFSSLGAADFYKDMCLTTRELLERYFPNRPDILRLLMEPIAYANGSTFEDPAHTYALVFSNFMQKGVYIFRGGTDALIRKMVGELERNGAVVRICANVERIAIEDGVVRGVKVGGRFVRAGAVVSNANLKSTVLKLAGPEHFNPGFIKEVEAVRMGSSSTQVYIGLKHGATIPAIGDLIFHSDAPAFSSASLLARKPVSRTFSVYYPDMRPRRGRTTIVSSTNAEYRDWAGLGEEEYQRQKQQLIEDTLVCLEQYIPGVRAMVDHVEAATPRTVESYTQHLFGASFGTKYEGLKVSRDLPAQVRGLFHAGSVGIIMSGWLGTVNYGVIVADRVDRFLHAIKTGRAQPAYAAL